MKRLSLLALLCEQRRPERSVHMAKVTSRKRRSGSQPNHLVPEPHSSCWMVCGENRQKDRRLPGIRLKTTGWCMKDLGKDRES